MHHTRGINAGQVKFGKDLSRWKEKGILFEFYFEADLSKSELRKGRSKMRLERKPWQLLVALLESPGKTASRAEIEKRLWPEGVVVDFEHGVNVAVKKLRQALLDSAAEPRYIETIPGEGYRFIATVEKIPSSATVPVNDVGPSNGTNHLGSTSAKGPPSRGWHRRLVFWWFALVLGLALVTSSSYRGRHSVPFKERDWVLIDGFENHTGEALFDGTLRAALERELSNSEFINVAPRDRVEDALRLMRKTPNTTLDSALAREVCLRDGGIRALVTGRTERLGATYLLSVQIVDPIQNIALASSTECAIGQDQIWPAVRRLSNWVRETLGETMERIDRSNRQMEKVTTPSLKALQLFTEADTAYRHQQLAVAGQLLRQAVVEDPAFASAHMLLAFTSDAGDWKGEAEKAFALAGSISERERYFISGLYEIMTGHPDRAVAPLEALVRRYPDHYQAYSHLSGVYRTLGHPELAAEIAARFADVRPNDPGANAAAAYWNQSIDLARARPYARRAADLRRESPGFEFEANTLFFHAHELWMQDDVNGVLKEIQRIASSPEGWSNPDLKPSVASALAYMYLTLGKFQTSEQWFESVERDAPDLLDRTATSARVLVSFIKTDVGDPHGSLLAPGWQLRHPDTGPTMQVPSGNRAIQLWARGEVLMTDGRFGEAATLLQDEFKTSYRRAAPVNLSLAERLATSLERAGNSQEALGVLEAASGARLWIAPNSLGYGAFWLRDQALLSSYYHRLGREAEARKIDTQLRKLLAVADSDHPILRQLNVR